MQKKNDFIPIIPVIQSSFKKFAFQLKYCPFFISNHKAICYSTLKSPVTKVRNKLG